MGGGVMSAVAKFTATGIRGIVPPLQSSLQSASEVSPAENRSSVTEAISNHSAPNRAFQAFQLLSESSEAQSVVASIASDPNIWNAMVRNPKLQDFFHSHETGGFEVEGTLDKKVEDLPYSDSVSLIREEMQKQTLWVQSYGWKCDNALLQAEISTLLNSLI